MHLNTVNRGYPTYSKRVFAYTELRIYTGEHLKRHTAGVLCFKSSPIPLPWRLKTCRFKSSMV